MAGARRMVFCRWILGGALIVSRSLSAADAADPQEIHPGEWQTRVLQLKTAAPDQSLTSALSEAPPVPSQNADEAAWTEHIQRATELLRKYYGTRGLTLPAGTAFAVDSKTSAVAVRTQAAEMAILEALTSFPVNREPPKIVFHLHVLQAPASMIRNAVDQARTRSDLTPLWNELRSLAGKEDIQILRTAQLEAEGDKLVSVNAGNSFKHPKQYKLNASGDVVADGEEETPELLLAIAPSFLAWHHPCVDFGVEFEYHFAPPSHRVELVKPNQGARGTEVSLLDFHRVKLFTGMSCEAGMTRLLAAWRPIGAPKLEQRDVLQAAFLSMDVASETSGQDAHLLSMLQKYADKVAPIPHREVLGNAGTKPILMKRLSLHVPPDFLTNNGTQTPPSNPATLSSNRAKEILMGAGVAFPAHAHAVYAPVSSMLVLVNTPAQLNLAEAFAESHHRLPVGIRQTLQVFQADAALVQKLANETARISNHYAAFSTLEALVDQGGAKLVSLESFETSSGQESTMSSGISRASLPDFAAPQERGTKTSSPQYHVFGTNWEILPTIGSNNLIETKGTLTCDSPLGDRHEIDTPFATKTKSSAVRLIAVWKIPTTAKSGPELMHVAFLREDLVNIKRAAIAK